MLRKYLFFVLILLIERGSFPANQDSLRVESLLLKGKSQLDAGDSGAVKSFREALSIARGKNFLYGSLKAEYYLGFTSRVNLNFASALDTYNSIMKKVQAAGYKDIEYDILSEIAYIYYNIGEYKDAFKFYELSLKNAENTSDKKKTALAYGNLGVLSEQWGYYDNAQYYFGMAKKIHEELRDTTGLVNTLNNLVITYLYTGKLDEAAETGRKAIRLAKASGYESGVIDASINLSAVLSEKEDYVTSISANLEALRIAEKLKRESDAGLALENIADNFYQLGEYKTAEGYARRALDKARILNSPEALKGAHEKLHLIYEKTGNYKSALFHLSEVSSLKDSLSQNDLSVQVAKLDERNTIKRQIEEEKRREAERARLEAEEKEKVSNLQYLIIMSVVFMIIFGVFFARRYSVNLKFIEILLFISILLLFEFIGILIDPYTESFSGGFPLPKLAINLILAVVIFFLDEYFDKKIKDKILHR